MYRKDSIAALATPKGIGALAIIRVSGEELCSLFKKITKKKTPVPRLATLSSIYCPTTKKTLDSAIIIYFKAPFSFTGEDLIEITCHGGHYIASSILDALFKLGVRPASAGEFSFRAFMNGKIDLTQAEAISELISAKSGLGVNNGLKNINGFVSRSVENIRKKVINMLSIIEHELDFSEEEIEQTNKEQHLLEIAKVKSEIRKLVKTTTIGKTLSYGSRVVLFGHPNAGKSSLFNYLLGYERTIVSNRSGTTRDVVEAWIEIEGVAVCLVDTAGYWDNSKNLIEVEGIERTKSQVEKADVVLFLDEKDPIKSYETAKNKLSFKKVFLIKTKSDIKKTKPTQKTKVLEISSKNGTGIDLLYKGLSTHLSSSLREIGPEDPVVVSKRQCHLLKEALNLLERAEKEATKGTTTDVLASYLHLTKDTLSEITGLISNEDLLNNIFSGFCVGK